MFILRDILSPLQDSFSDTKLGRKRAQWFTYTLLSVIIPFTSSMTSNLLRTLRTLFGLTLDQGRFLYLYGLTIITMESAVAAALEFYSGTSHC